MSIITNLSSPVKFNDKFSLAGDISPAQITADQNDYNPTGLSTASALRLTSNTAVNITGLQGGEDGRIVSIVNIGTNNITLKNENLSSSAANRFALNADIVLGSNHGCILQYDSTSSRWRAIASTVEGAGGGGSGGLIFIEKQILTADATSVTFSGLNGDTHGVYVIHARIRNNTASTNTIEIRPNGATTNFRSRLANLSSSYSTSAFTDRLVLAQMAGGAGTHYCAIQVIFHAKKDPDTESYRRTYHSQGSRVDAGSLELGQFCAGDWNETATNITSLEIRSDQTNGMDKGSEFVLYRLAQS